MKSQLEINFLGLKLAKLIDVKDYNLYKFIFDEVKNTKATVIEFEQFDVFRLIIDNNEWLLDFNNWVTFDNCIDLKFYIEQDKLYCNLTCFNGDNLLGLIKSTRFKLKVELDKQFLLKLTQPIEFNLNEYYEDLYRKHLEKQKNDWINNQKAKDFKTIQ